jgi:aryl-alcohol dehydrogenase-like predicted oxidoreductase
MASAPRGRTFTPDAGQHLGQVPGKRRLGPFKVSAMGLGAMRLAGPNVFGPPANRDDAVALLRAAVESGVDHIDTAQYYGPVVVNELIQEALHPYPPALVLVSKVGARRGSRGEIFADDKPDRLRRGIEENLRTLKTDHIGIVNLRLMTGAGPDSVFDDQLAAMQMARDDGLIRAIGLSNVSLSHLLHALKITEIACVQNAFHPADRTSQPVLDECTRRGIAFVPFAPLGFGSSSVLADPTIVSVASRSGCTPAQACLAWELAVAPNLLLIPGTSSMQHLHENLAAEEIRLDDRAMQLVSDL